MQDALRTYVQHIVVQISKSLLQLKKGISGNENLSLLITGGGAHNLFLTERLKEEISPTGIESVIPDERPD